MQEPLVKLKEIIWEITGRCENKCFYCGSKDVWNVPIDDKRIIDIAKKIAVYPPEQIDVSGGDPLLVSFETHKKVVKILKDAKVLVKILVNPKSFMQGEVWSTTSNSSVKRKVLGLYDWIGLSVNTKEELDCVSNLSLVSDNTTIITNFNAVNVFLFDEIKKVVKEHDSRWQIQFTVSKDPEDSIAIYNNEGAMCYLSERVNSAFAEKVDIVLSDNCNNGICTAGRYSCGILWSGNVIPCLSMRSWVSSIDDCVVGNIREKSLQEIWENCFDDYRIRQFKCCKDHCKNKYFVPCLPDYKFWTYPPVSPSVTLYGVSPTPVYAVFPSPTIMYGVGGSGGSGTYLYAVPTKNDVSSVTCFYLVTTK